MLLQGNLQLVFDALYEMGVIDPILKKDWGPILASLPRDYVAFSQAIQDINRHDDMDGLMQELSRLEPKILEYVAMEVAREYADYHERPILH